MAWGDIDGKCRVSFVADLEKEGDCRQTPACLDVPAARVLREYPNKKKKVTICFPHETEIRKVDGEWCAEIVLKRSESIHFETEIVQGK